MKYSLNKISFIVLIIIISTSKFSVNLHIENNQPAFIILNNKQYEYYKRNILENLSNPIKTQQINNYKKNVCINVTFLLFLSLIISLGTKISLTKYPNTFKLPLVITVIIIFVLLFCFFITSLFIKFSPKIILLLSFLILFVSSIMLGFLLEYISKKYTDITTLISWENCGPVLAGLLATLIINYFFPMALNIINTIVISIMTIASIIILCNLIFKINVDISKVFINYLGVLSAWIGLMESIKRNEKFIEDYKIAPIVFNNEDWNIIIWNNCFHIAISCINFIVKFLKYLIEKERQKRKSSHSKKYNNY